MKKLLLSISLVFISVCMIAQAPQAFKYQAIARDIHGDILANQEISLKISIIQGSKDGPVVYAETHTVTTNEFGLINIDIGKGRTEDGEWNNVTSEWRVASGDFRSINWADASYFLKIEFDEQCGDKYKEMGVSQLLSVPYALYAESSGNTGTRAGEWAHAGGEVFLDEGTFPGANVGIGTNAPGGRFHVQTYGFASPAKPALFVEHSIGYSSTFRRVVNNTGNALFLLQKARGTIASPTAVLNGDNIGQIRMEGYDGTDYKTAGLILVQVAGTPSTGNVPGAMIFGTAPQGGIVTERMRISCAGNIGINTSAPMAPLQIESSSGSTALNIHVTNDTTNTNGILRFTNANSNPDAGTYSSFIAGVRTSLSGSQSLVFATCLSSEAPTEKMRIAGNGNVGIGTTTINSGRLRVDGGSDKAAVLVNNDAGGIHGATLHVSNDNTGEAIAGWFESIGSDATVNIKQLGTGPILKLFGPNGGGEEVEIDNDGKIHLYNADHVETIRFYPAEAGDGDGGSIYMYNSSGVQTLELDGDDGNAANILLRNSTNVQTIALDADDSGAGTIYITDATGASAITLYGDYMGHARIKTEELEITGGSDIAEPFDVISDQQILPGMVLSIDPENPGKLRLSDHAYDRCVAGVVSGAGNIQTGMLMHQFDSGNTGDYPVALTGRVYCYVDASYGSVRPGDLLTTSPTPGYAMVVKDNEEAQGAILGKAMTSLEQGKDLVFILVTLQ